MANSSTATTCGSATMADGLSVRTASKLSATDVDPSLMSYQPQQFNSYQPQASAYQPMSYQPLMAIPQQSNYYLPQTSVCHATCQLQQLSVQQLIAGSPIVQHPIVQQLQPDSCQPVMQRSEPIIYQQYIANNQDGEFESEVLASGVSRKLEDSFSANMVKADDGNKETHTDSLVLEEPQKSMDKIPIDEQDDDYQYEYVQGESGRYNKECKQHGSIYRLVRENLDKYIVSTGNANIVILTRVLAVIFTEYNRGFCLSLWDPGG